MSAERDDSIEGIRLQQQLDRTFSPFVFTQPTQEERETAAIRSVSVEGINPILATEIGRAAGRVTPETQALRTTDANIRRAQEAQIRIAEQTRLASLQKRQLQTTLNQLRNKPFGFTIQDPETGRTRTVTGQDRMAIQDQINDIDSFIEEAKTQNIELEQFKNQATGQIFEQIQPIQEARIQARRFVQRGRDAVRSVQSFNTGVGTQIEEISRLSGRFQPTSSLLSTVTSGGSRRESELLQRSMGVPRAGSLAQRFGLTPSAISRSERFFAQRIDPIVERGREEGLRARVPLERGQPANLLGVVSGAGFSFVGGALQTITTPLRPRLIEKTLTGTAELLTSPRSRAQFVEQVAQDPTGAISSIAGGVFAGRLGSRIFDRVLPVRPSVRFGVFEPEELLPFESEAGLFFPQETSEFKAVSEIGSFSPSGESIIEGVVSGESGGMGEFFIGRGSQKTPFSRTFRRTGGGLSESIIVPEGVTPRPIFRPRVFTDLVRRPAFLPSISIESARNIIPSTSSGLLSLLGATSQIVNLSSQREMEIQRLRSLERQIPVISQPSLLRINESTVPGVFGGISRTVIEQRPILRTGLRQPQIISTVPAIRQIIESTETQRNRGVGLFTPVTARPLPFNLRLFPDEQEEPIRRRRQRFRAFDVQSPVLTPRAFTSGILNGRRISETKVRGKNTTVPGLFGRRGRK